MKAVTVGYFQQQHTLTAPCPVQFQTLCESSRLYEPGSQYMKFVKRLPQPQITRFSERDPFCFEPYTEGLDNVLSLEKQRKVSRVSVGYRKLFNCFVQYAVFRIRICKDPYHFPRSGSRMCSWVF
jgi:hypothetical protein